MQRDLDFSSLYHNHAFLSTEWQKILCREHHPPPLKAPKLQSKRLESYKGTCLRTKSESLWFKPQATASFWHESHKLQIKVSIPWEYWKKASDECVLRYFFPHNYIKALFTLSSSRGLWILFGIAKRFSMVCDRKLNEAGDEVLEFDSVASVAKAALLRGYPPTHHGVVWSFWRPCILATYVIYC